MRLDLISTGSITATRLGLISAGSITATRLDHRSRSATARGR
jgi:hypothetical protein